MATWRSSRTWRRYKAAFEKVETIKSLGRLEKLEDEATDLERMLPQAFPGRPDLTRPLTEMLRDRLVARRRVLQTPRGRLPRPDWKADLALSIDWLDRTAAALRELRALDGRDPWIDEKLAPEVESCVSAVEAALHSLEEQLPGDPETPSLASRARAAVAAARPPLEGGADHPSEQDFRKARYPRYGESPCSPKPAREFRGLLIRLPGNARIPATGPVTLDPDAPWLPVCGVIRLPNEDLADVGVPPIERVVLVFVDRATGVPIRFNLVPHKSRVPRNPKHPSDVVVLDSIPEDQIDRDYLFNQYFNIDVLMFCPDFPRRTARYRVHAVLGRWESNVVEVDVEAY